MSEISSQMDCFTLLIIYNWVNLDGLHSGPVAPTCFSWSWILLWCLGPLKLFQHLIMIYYTRTGNGALWIFAFEHTFKVDFWRGLDCIHFCDNKLLDKLLSIKNSMQVQEKDFIPAMLMWCQYLCKNVWHTTGHIVLSNLQVASNMQEAGVKVASGYFWYICDP